MWKFTQACQNIAGFHHEPSAAAEVHRPLVTLVKIADTICCRDPKGFNLTARSQEIDEETLSYVGLAQKHLDAVKETMAAKIKDAMSIFAV
jgi:hypothetical protein